MRRDDLMKSDLFSEALLLACGIALGTILAMTVIVAFTSMAPVQ
jgi:hypothetical protein